MFSLINPLIETLNPLIEIVNESNLKPNGLWADQESEFYNKLMQEWQLMIKNRIKLLDQCNNSYHRSIKKKPINASCSAWTENNELNSKPSKFLK